MKGVAVNYIELNMEVSERFKGSEVVNKAPNIFFGCKHLGSKTLVKHSAHFKPFRRKLAHGFLHGGSAVDIASLSRRHCISHRMAFIKSVRKSAYGKPRRYRSIAKAGTAAEISAVFREIIAVLVGFVDSVIPDLYIRFFIFHQINMVIAKAARDFSAPLLPNRKEYFGSKSYSFIR